MGETALAALMSLSALWGLEYRTVRTSKHATTKSSVSGYGTKGLDWLPKAGRLEEGAPVVDKRWLEKTSESFVRDVLRCPLLDVDASENESTGLMSNHPGWSYCTIETYLEYWRSRGARIGYRRGDLIEWEDGGVLEIPAGPDTD